MKQGADFSSSHTSEKKCSQKNVRFRLSVNQIKQAQLYHESFTYCFHNQKQKIVKKFEKTSIKMMISELLAKKSYLRSSTLSQIEKK